jgi:hypothetical protein
MVNRRDPRQISNPVENLWTQCNARDRKRMIDSFARTHATKEYIALAQEEWVQVDWEAVDKIERVPGKMAKILKAWNGHTKILHVFSNV